MSIGAMHEQLIAVTAERDALRQEVERLRADGWRLDEMIGARDESVATLEAARNEAVTDRDKLLRLLFFRHGCPSSAMYGDDGEMQCHGCFVDFKRMTAEEIEQTWMRTALLKIT